MAQDKIDQLTERVAWLELKMVRVLWCLISLSSAFASLAIAYIIDRSFGWIAIIAGIAIWLVLGFVLKKQEFKGAPKHIEFIDP